MAEDKDYRQVLTDKIIEQLEQGTAPWQKPWDAAPEQLPYNPVTGKPYRGANSLYLSMAGDAAGYGDPRWATYKQAAEQGWQVRKGEKGALVEYWKFTDQKPAVDGNGNPILDENGQQKMATYELERPRVFRAVVFNARQMDGVPELSKEPRQYEWDPVDKAEKILEASGAKIFHDQPNRAFYSPSRDEIHMPSREQFRDQSAYYSTALHELGHWTGHESRLGRDLGNSFGSVEYAKEELRAELSSYFMADKLGIPHDPSQHASYVQSWIKVLKEDKNEIFRAARDAEKITEYVIGLEQQREQTLGQAQVKAPEQAPTVSPEMGKSVAQEKTFLNVPYPEREAARSAGAKWDKEAKLWYAPPGTDLAPLAKWSRKEEPAKEVSGREVAGQEAAAREPAVGKPAAREVSAGEKTWLAVPYPEREAARSAGAKWDKEAKSWYAPPGASLEALDKWLPKKDLAQDAERKQNLDPKEEFAKALKAAGLVIEGAPVMDGKMQRVPVEDGKPGNRDGAYVGYLDGKPSGFIQNYKSGLKENWKLDGVELSAAEQAQLAAQAQLMKQQRAAELAEGYAKTAERVAGKWERLPEVPAGENAYLGRKQVPGIGVKYDGEKLVVPVRDVDGKLWSLQSISPEAGLPKMFEKGGRKAGNMHVLGELKPGSEILVAEGYATGASLHLATGKTVAVAFDSGNLNSVVGALKERYPTSPIFICGDNDKHQQQNVGVEKALAAAEKHQVGAVFPAFQAPEGHKLSDFNDLHVTEGLGAVKAQVEAAMAQTMEKSRQEAVEMAKGQLGADMRVETPRENTRHTGEVLGVTGYHAAQENGDRAVIHEKCKLDQVPVPGRVATIQYQDGRGQVTDRTLAQQQQKQQQVQR